MQDDDDWLWRTAQTIGLPALPALATNYQRNRGVDRCWIGVKCGRQLLALLVF